MESELTDRLFEDPFARALAGDAGFAIHERTAAGGVGSANPYLSIRTRFLDDALRGAMDLELRQVVILAAGMDARVFRLPWPADTVLFEVDRDEIFAYKEPILADLDARPACDRRIVRADLEHDWTTPLAGAGFDPEKPTAFLVEGLLVYLPEDAVDRFMSTLAGIAAPGSWLGTDLAGVELLTSPWMKTYLDKLAEFGCPWIFGVADPEAFLSGYGWSSTIVMPGDPDANFGRWPYPRAPKGVPGVPRSYFAVGRR
jgi:methyltransferase (TIGR00027 family)